MAWLCARCRTRFEVEHERCPHDGKRVVADLAGQIVAGRYALRELLGIGGMDGSVWLAWQTSTHRPVAIKLLPPADSAATERFARGARIASSLNHPNITIVHDYGQTEQGQLFLVMELLEGKTLHRLMKEGPIPFERTLHVTDQMLRALDHAHKRNVVHRDIKPGNLFLISQNEDPDFVKVLDFGIARFIDADDSVDEVHEVTRERQICGTPQYMAPEQVSFGDVDARTDLYALGVVLYRMLTGQLPFRSSSHQELFRHHVHTSPPPFAEVAPDRKVPAEVETLVMRALEKRSADRFASAGEMRLALRQVRARLGMLSDEGSQPSGTWMEPTPTAPPEPDVVEFPGGDRRWPLILVLLLLGAGLAAGTMYLLRAEPADPTVGDQTGSPTVAGADSQEPVVVVATPKDAGPIAAAATAQAADTAPAHEVDASTPVPKVEKGRVVLSSTPTGATVVAGGRSLGRTPLRASLPAGINTLRLVHPKRKTTWVRIEVMAGGEITHNVRLARARDRAAAARPKPPAVKPVAVEAPPEVLPEPVATKPKPASGKVKLQLLDEDGARSFDVGGSKKPPKPPSGPKPAIELLDE